MDRNKFIQLVKQNLIYTQLNPIFFSIFIQMKFGDFSSFFSLESICYRQGLMVRAFLFYWSNEHSFKFSRMSFLAGVVRASERGEKNNRWGVILQERTTGVLRKYFTEWSFDHKLTERDFPLPQNHLSRKWGFCYLPDRMDGAKFFSLLYQSKKGH